jgi:hypothetical protein
MVNALANLLVKTVLICEIYKFIVYYTQKNLLLGFDDTAYAKQYDKCISKVVRFSLHFSRRIFNVSPIERQHVFSYNFYNIMYLLSQISGVLRKTY